MTVGTTVDVAPGKGQEYQVVRIFGKDRRLKQKCKLNDLHFHDIRAKALTDAKRKSGSDYAQALGNHASVETTESYIKAREVNTVRPLF